MQELQESQEIQWKTEKRFINDLKDHPKNPRCIKKEQLEQLKKSIKKFNYVETVVINLDNTILAGHMRIKAMKSLKLGKNEIDVRVPNRKLTEEEAQEYLIRSNKNTGEWDWDILANEWEIEKLFEFGFTEEELQIPKSENAKAEDDGFEEELPEQPKTKLGDIYELGPHKIICGSATSEEDILKICAKESIDLIITDPPYNVAYEGKTKDSLTIQNDNMSSEDFAFLLQKFYVNAYKSLKPGCGIYVFHADREGEKFRKYFRESGLKLSQCLVWVKNAFVMGRQDYHSQHEPCLYGWREGEKHRWHNDRKQTTLLKFDRPQRNKEHPTMKPIPMLGYLINNSTKEGDCVMDFFLGSGSTLIACEQLGRKCLGSELDPKYCDVIVDRYRKYKFAQNEQCEIKLNGEIYNG